MRAASFLNEFCPMHIGLNACGQIVRAGPTMRKLRAGKSLNGSSFFDVFEMCRPYVETMDELLLHRKKKLHLRFKDVPQTRLKAVLVPAEQGGALLNFGFGISLVDAVHDYALVGSDFAATELAMEMLYLMEAKSAAMSASRHLNARLQDAMVIAEEQAVTDTLTGLKNRRALDRMIGGLLEQAREFAVMQLDLDHFKLINDRLGHAAGDHVLQAVAQILVEETRAGDFVARIGGDEFVIVFVDVSDRKALERTAQRIIAKVEKPIYFGSEPCHISASCGTALALEASPVSPEQLLDDADTALYASKKAGRARHSFFSSEMCAASSDTEQA